MSIVSTVSEAPATGQLRQLRAVDGSESRRVWVRCSSSALDFYLAVGCEIHQVADGWAQLGNAATRFVLAIGGDSPSSSPPVPALTSPDLTGLCRRLRTMGVEPGQITYSASAPGGRIEVRDPDQHTVVICQAVAAAATTSPAQAFEARSAPMVRPSHAPGSECGGAPRAAIDAPGE